jgi:hypothetical protein
LEDVPFGLGLLLLFSGLALVYLGQGTGLALFGALPIIGGLALAAWALKSEGKKCPGEKESAIRTIATRAKQNMPTIRSDLELLEKLLQAYVVK